MVWWLLCRNREGWPGDETTSSKCLNQARCWAAM